MLESHKSFLGYLVFLIVLIVALVILSQAAITPWVYSLAPIIALMISIKFVDNMSLLTCSIIVLLLTAIAPIYILIVIGAGVNESLVNYTNLTFALQILTPTLVTILFLIFIKRK